jgi:pantothenate kinase
MSEIGGIEELANRIASMRGTRRRIVAIAGPPGSGKSTFADHLKQYLNRERTCPADILAMDGFHYDDMVLVPSGLRCRKGAPDTFDVDGLAVTLRRLGADDGRDVAVPIFDRGIEIARAGARIIAASVRVVIVEGNYLLLDDPDWSTLRSHFDLTVMLDVSDAILEDRLSERWRAHGLDAAALRAKLEDNDLPNARLVKAKSVKADYVVVNY